MRSAAVRATFTISLLILTACGGGGGSDTVATPVPPVPPPPPPPPPSDPIPGQLSLVGSVGTNPGNLKMYAYVPTGLATNRPIVVILPGCGGKASQYDDDTGWTKWADQMHFALIIPEPSVDQPQGCFRYWADDHTRRGAGEPQSIYEMVQWLEVKYSSDPTRIFVTGLSAGGAMTNVMLATYPDVFAAGAPIAGMPYKCAPDNNPGACTGGAITATPQAWGDKVRAANVWYSGPWPRVSIWVGTADTTVSPVNEIETMKQWTNVNDHNQTPDTTETVKGYPHEIYGRVETWEITGLPHSIAVDPGPGPDQCGTSGFTDMDICSSLYIARWFGLDH